MLIVNKAREAAACAEANCASSFTNATNAANSATAAAASETNVENIWEDFQDRYMGPFASPPVAPGEGSMYYNTVSNVLFVWNGSAWVSADFNEFTNFTATGTISARNLVTRTSEFVNVKDFGATGNGVTDDRAAFIAAANAATAANKTLVIPPGNYYLTGGGLIPIGDIYIECYGNITGPGAAFGAQQCPFGTGNFAFHKKGTYQNILQFDRWNVNPTDAEAHAGIAVLRRYDGVANVKAWNQSGTPLYGYVHYGAERASQPAKASGTVNSVCGFVNVFSLDNGTGGGRSEIVPMAGAVSCSPTASITADGAYYNEFSINGPTGTSVSDPQREGFMAGACYLVQKYCPGNTKDATHEGSYGVTICTRPGSGGFDFPRPAGVENYKLFAGIAVNGWTGVAGSATDGYSPSANSAYEWGMIIGGHGSVWTPYTSNSKIDNGVGIRDYVFSGLSIFNKHPDADPNAVAIGVAADAGISCFGFTNTGGDVVTKIQVQTSGTNDAGIRIWQTTNPTTKKASIIIGDWAFGQDRFLNGTKDFALWDGTTNRIAISVADATPANRFNYFNSNIVPIIDNTYTCGANGARWSAIWSANGVIQTSDQRAKTDIEPTPLGLDFINKLNPVSYKWVEGSRVVVSIDELGNETTEPVAGQRTHHGLLAQEVKAALPEGVDFGGWVLTDKENPDSQQALRYDQFIAPLINAIKELSAKVEALESK